MIKYIKYEVFLYDIFKDEDKDEDYVYGIFVSSKSDTSKSSLCKKLGLDDPYKIDVDYNEDVIYIDYDGKPYCELRKKEVL